MPGNPSHIWLMSEASGNLIDQVGAVDLVPSGSPIYERQAVGLWDGTSAFAKKAVEFPGGSGSFAAGSSSELDFDGTTSFAFLVVFRGFDGGNGGFLEKNPAGSSPEYLLGGASGDMRFSINDGVNGDGPASVSKNFKDGAPHVVMCVCDRNADLIGIYTDMGNDEVSGLTAGSLSNGAVFTVHADSVLIGQVAYLAFWEGAAAEGLNQTHLDNFWKAFQDPSGKLTTYARASLFSDVVGQDGGEDRVAHYSGEPSTPQIALGWHSALTHGQGFGLRSATAITNEVPNSEDLTAWTTSNASVTANQGDAPDGFRSADELSASAADGYGADTYTTTESTQYTQSVWVKRSGSSDVTGRLIMYDASNAVERASQTITATSTWQRVTLTATTATGQVSTELRVEIDVSGEAMLVWGAQAVEGAEALPYVRTSGAAASTVAVDARAAGNYVHESKGEVEQTLLAERPAEESIARVFSTSDGTELREMFISSGSLSTPVRDAAGSSVYQPNPGSLSKAVEHVARLQWNEDGDVLGTSSAVRGFLDETTDDGGGSFTSGDAFQTAVQIGNSGGSNESLILTSRLRCYDAPKKEAA